MQLSNRCNERQLNREKRKFSRLEVQCRARIVIGTRHYTGYLHNISRGGARLRTITPIRKLGKVILRLPDLPVLKCALCWTDAYHAGVAFELMIPERDLQRWARQRQGISLDSLEDAEISIVPELGSAGVMLGSDCRGA